MKAPAPVRLLLLDDDAVDVMTVRRALLTAPFEHELTVFRDGAAALEHLRGSPEPPPIILLDLNLPAMTGHEFLAELRAHPQCRLAVVFVLTTSDAERDRRLAYQHQVAGYFHKSDLGPDFLPLVDFLSLYCRLSALPGRCRAWR